MLLLPSMAQRLWAICCECQARHTGRADARLVPLDEMQTRFGEESIWVYNILRGIDHTEGKSGYILRLKNKTLADTRSQG
jgi:hypothetical protein